MAHGPYNSHFEHFFRPFTFVVKWTLIFQNKFSQASFFEDFFTKRKKLAWKMRKEIITVYNLTSSLRCSTAFPHRGSDT